MLTDILDDPVQANLVVDYLYPVQAARNPLSCRGIDAAAEPGSRQAYLWTGESPLQRLGSTRPHTGP